jgi:hypothetical protein
VDVFESGLKESVEKDGSRHEDVINVSKVINK